MPRLFALDHNFPDPIVEVLTEFQADATLVRVDRIDERMADLDDWELLLALHHHAEPWDGLIATDSSGRVRPRPRQGIRPLFAYLAGICNRTRPDQPQAWTLNAAINPHREPWDFLKRFAEHNNRTTDDVWAEFKLSPDELAQNPLAEG